MVVFALVASAIAANEMPVTLVQDGSPTLPILVDKALLPLEGATANTARGIAAEEAPQPGHEQGRAVRELLDYVKRMSGATLSVQAAAPGAVGCYVGLDTSFSWVKQDLNDLGPEGFSIRSDGHSAYLLARTPLGLRQAVTTFLMEQGCRWFFPGRAWEVIPRNATIQVAGDLRQSPSFATERRLWYGYGAYPSSARDYQEWMVHNRMGGPVSMSIGHTWAGLNRERDFAAHPEWFALVKGKRKPSKPCYSNPEVIQKMIAHGLNEAAGGTKSFSLTPPDGLGYCECERCKAAAGGGEAKEDQGSLFIKRPDGVTVCVVSETLFNAINQVAKAVTQKYPRVAVCAYAYSAYSEPPSFPLEPNVAIEVTTTYRRTHLSLEEQLDQWGQLTHHLGIRGYWSVFQWDRDNPGLWDWKDPENNKKAFVPEHLQMNLQNYQRHHATAFNAEASNNWGPRGLSYYIGAQLLWNVNADVKPLIRDFYEKAFGPAARPMEHYYVRWSGPSVAVIDPASAQAAAGAVYEAKALPASRKTLTAVFKDLDEATLLVADKPEYRQRVDQVRMYACYLWLRLKVWEAAAARNNAATLAAIKEETLFGGRLTDVNMIHSRALLGKGFERHFKPYASLLKGVPEAAEWNKGFRRVGPEPTHEELEKLWAQWKASQAGPQ
jgi:hypothetical protein